MAAIWELKLKTKLKNFFFFFFLTDGSKDVKIFAHFQCFQTCLHPQFGSPLMMQSMGRAVL